MKYLHIRDMIQKKDGILADYKQLLGEELLPRLRGSMNDLSQKQNLEYMV
jgi:hypothetical protein